MKQNAADIIVMSRAFFILKTGRATLAEDGKQYRFIKPYKRGAQEIIDIFKSRMQSDLSSADDGIYTWIIKDDGKIYLSKTLGNQEIGSLHVNLDMYSGEANVVAAGELKKEGTTVTYNLRSGTYMEKVIKARDIRNEKVKLVSDLISKNGLTPKFLKCKTDENGNGTEDCTEEYETLAGLDIIDKTSKIVTPMAEIELYKTMFTVEEINDKEEAQEAQGGGYRSRGRSRSRSRSRSSTKSKQGKRNHKSKTRRARLI
jgi:hypothetical protein